MLWSCNLPTTRRTILAEHCFVDGGRAGCARDPLAIHQAMLALFGFAWFYLAFTLLELTWLALVSVRN
jgi:hypothetical protein